MVVGRKLVVVGALLIGIGLLALSAAPCLASVNVGVGDFWKYQFTGDEEGLVMSGTMMQKVTKTQGSGSNGLFVVGITGNGTVSGTIESVTVTGTMTVTGTDQRLASNFSLTSETMMIEIQVAAIGLTIDMSFGMSLSFSPASDDYIGDDNPGLGGHVTTDSTMSGSMWMNMLGNNQSMSMDSSATTTMTVGSSMVNVTVPAGTFDCYKVTATTVEDGSSSSETYYYSDKVGNYVKMESGDALMGIGPMELTDYSHKQGGGDIMSYITGKNAWVTGLVIVIVIVIVAVVLLMTRKAKPGPIPQMPPPPEGYTPPPPQSPGTGPGPGSSP